MHQHQERHFSGGDFVRDIVIGMSDGLTVPFALAAGLAGAIASSRLVLTAGGAEIAAGCIAMGLGGYLAAHGDAEHYAAERRREMAEVVEVPEKEIGEVVEILRSYGLDAADSERVSLALSRDPEKWVDFMMRFELGLEEPDPKRAMRSGATIAGAYIAGGIVPLLPYFFMSKAREALPYSAALTLAALLVFGVIKGKFAGTLPLRSGLQTVLVGGLAAAAAFALAKAFS